MSTTNTRIAVVGAGNLVGIQHCEAIQGLAFEDAELVCVCQRRAEDVHASERFGAKHYVDAHEMARQEDLDGVVIAAPTHLHLPLVQACIAGARERAASVGRDKLQLRSILVEKPLCENLAAALQLVEVAETAGVQILVGHQRRHSTFVQHARNIVTHSNFGPLRGLSAEFSLLKPESYFKSDHPGLGWRSTKGTGGPILLNLIHDVDILRFITGHEVVRVFAHTSSSARTGDVEDTGGVVVVLDHGAIGTFFFSDAAPSPWSYEFTTRENKKYPAVPGFDSRDCYHFLGAQQSLGFPSLCTFNYSQEVQEPGWDAPLSVEKSSVSPENPLESQMRHFLKVCRGDELPLCSGRDGLQSLAVIAAVLKAAETQQVVCPCDLLREAAEINKDDSSRTDSDGMAQTVSVWTDSDGASQGSFSSERSTEAVQSQLPPSRVD